MKSLRNKDNTNPPLPGEVEEGQLAINLVDGRLHTKDHNGNVIGLGGDVLSVDTIADLATAPITRTVFVKDSDRGGLFVYDASRAGENDRGTIFDGWKRQYNGSINVKWFGVTSNAEWSGNNNVASGTTTASAYTEIMKFDDIYFPKGKYIVDTPLQLRSGQRIRGESAIDTNVYYTGDTGALFEGIKTSATAIFNFSVENIRLYYAGSNKDDNAKLLNLKWAYKFFFKNVSFFGNYVNGDGGVSTADTGLSSIGVKIDVAWQFSFDHSYIRVFNTGMLLTSVDDYIGDFSLDNSFEVGGCNYGLVVGDTGCNTNIGFHGIIGSTATIQGNYLKGLYVKYANNLTIGNFYDERNGVSLQIGVPDDEVDNLPQFIKVNNYSGNTTNGTSLYIQNLTTCSFFGCTKAVRGNGVVRVIEEIKAPYKYSETLTYKNGAADITGNLGKVEYYPYAGMCHIYISAKDTIDGSGAGFVISTLPSGANASFFPPSDIFFSYGGNKVGKIDTEGNIHSDVYGNAADDGAGNWMIANVEYSILPLDIRGI